MGQAENAKVPKMASSQPPREAPSGGLGRGLSGGE